MTRRYITVREAAELLSLSEKSCYKMAIRGDIPSIRIGRARRVDLLRLEKMLEEQIADDRN